MGRLIAIDYGLKRVGIAETDDAQIIASPLTTIETKSLFKFLLTYFEKHKVDAMILGFPKQLDGNDSHITEDVRKIKVKLENTFAKKVILVDERFTSKMASFEISQSGLKKSKREEKGLIDQMSAALILRDFLAYGA